MNPKVDGFLRKAKKWRDEMAELRRIVLTCPLTEEMKWMHPCYSLNGSNVVLIHAFKEYCALLFFKGVLLKDDAGVLIQQTKNVQAGRQIRFTSLEQIIAMEATLKAYIHEAIEAEKAGLKVKLKKTSEFPMPEEFKKALGKNPALKTAFRMLTPGRQRAYLLHFSAPKQSRTREARIEKYTRHILDGEGLNDV
jgi:uncharacterized protein YdeI (YjbR/CyaY-like superfamily)